MTNISTESRIKPGVFITLLFWGNSLNLQRFYITKKWWWIAISPIIIQVFGYMLMVLIIMFATEIPDEYSYYYFIFFNQIIQFLIFASSVLSLIYMILDVIKFAQGNLLDENKAISYNQTNQKIDTTTGYASSLLYGFFLGVFGVHDFKNGRVIRGLVKVLLFIVSLVFLFVGIIFFIQEFISISETSDNGDQTFNFTTDSNYLVPLLISFIISIALNILIFMGLFKLVTKSYKNNKGEIVSLPESDLKIA